MNILPNVTKEYVLKNVTQEQIFEKYFNISIVFNDLICSPKIIREDKNPTCSFYYKNNRLKFRDFSGSFWGDCFDAVGFCININSNSKQGFRIILDDICKTFKIHKYKNKDFKTTKKESLNTIHKIKQQKTTFYIKYRKYNKNDSLYWNKFNINISLLIERKIYSAQEIYIFKNDKWILIYQYKIKDPAYCFFIGVEKTVNLWKIYYPLRKKNEIRFQTNNSWLQGLQYIIPDKFCVITKSYKDVLCFYLLGIQAIAVPSETHLITIKEYLFLKRYYDYLFLNFDYDLTGIRTAIKYKKKYGIPLITFTKKYNAKDLAEYIEKFGFEKAKELVNNTIEKIKLKYNEYENSYLS